MDIDRKLTRQTSLPSPGLSERPQLRRTRSTPSSSPSEGVRERSYADLSREEKMAVRKLAAQAGVPKKLAHAAMFNPSDLKTVHEDLGSKRKHLTEHLSKLAGFASALKGERVPGTDVTVLSLRANLAVESNRRTQAAKDAGDATGARANDHFTDAHAQIRRMKSLSLSTRIGRKLQAVTEPTREALTYQGMRAKASVAQAVKGAIGSARSSLGEQLDALAKTADQIAHSAQKGVDDGFNIRGGRAQRHIQENTLFLIATGAREVSPNPKLSQEQRALVKAWLVGARADAKEAGIALHDDTPWKDAYPHLARVANAQRDALESLRHKRGPLASKTDRAPHISASQTAKLGRADSSRAPSPIPAVRERDDDA